jgi:predicted phage terminase large subunit-like protein
VIEPTTPLVWSWHMEAVASHLQAVTEGRVRKLLINIPPRSSKSTLVSVLWPTWEWSRDPSGRWLFASYSLDLSTRHSLQRIRIIQSDWYQERYGDRVALSRDMANKREFENTATGYMIATSVGGTVTGRGGNRLILDDPHNVGEAGSDVIRAGVLDWFNTAWATRRNNATASSEVCIMQRIHEDDVAGEILRAGGWDHLNIPMEFDPEAARETSIGWRDPRAARGDLLCPERWPTEVVADLKARLGSYAYAGQYQQRPAPAEGGLFRREWFGYYDLVDGGRVRLDDGVCLDPRSHIRFVTVDLAASLRESADYTVIAVWGLYRSNPSKLILLDLERERIEGPDILPRVHRAVRTWGAKSAYIERAGFQLAFVQAAKRAGIPVRELEADKDKVSRSMTAQAMMEAGRILFPRNAGWLADYERELLLFPTGSHDDQVDVTSYAAEIAGTLGKDFAAAGADSKRKPEIAGILPSDMLADVGDPRKRLLGY